MKVITLNNEKGGVGKTTLAIHIAMYEAMQGQRVMLIDTDAQGHSTVRLGHSKSHAFYDLMVRDADWGDVTRLVSPEQYMHPDQTECKGTLYLVPSNVETRNVANSITNVATLYNRLNELREEDVVDLVIIDTSPTPSLLMATLFFASDAIIFPTSLASMSFDGLLESVKHQAGISLKRQDMAQLPMIELLGIVPTIYKSHTLEQSDNYDQLKAYYNEKVMPALGDRIIWTEAETRKCPIWQLNPKSKAMREFTRLMGVLKGAITHG